jgi:two-component system cell cycle response regulator DivK
VLIADDHDDTRRLYSQYLRAKGWEVEDVADGAEALTVAAVFAPHVILMDVEMPNMDGVAATQSLKRDERTRAIPVVVLSANSSNEGAALSAGCAEFLTKPLMPKELLAALEEVVDRKPKRGSTIPPARVS